MAQSSRQRRGGYSERTFTGQVAEIALLAQPRGDGIGCEVRNRVSNPHGELRAGMKPPIDPRFPHYEDRGFVHWDLDTSKPLPERLGVQGVLALTDTTVEMGGFQCIPGFHRELAAWIREQPEDRNPRSPDLSRLPAGYRVTPIPMPAGDLLIWDRMLAHGNGRNEGMRPRLAQYITMYPATDDEEQRQERIACWREGRAPAHWEREIPEKYRGRERHGAPAELTPLGRKLLGLDLW